LALFRLAKISSQKRGRRHGRRRTDAKNIPRFAFNVELRITFLAAKSKPQAVPKAGFFKQAQHDLAHVHADWLKLKRLELV
jgi:hypothetical protein